jgi:hypothetical protein
MWKGTMQLPYFTAIGIDRGVVCWPAKDPVCENQPD